MEICRQQQYCLFLIRCDNMIVMDHVSRLRSAQAYVRKLH